MITASDIMTPLAPGSVTGEPDGRPMTVTPDTPVFELLHPLLDSGIGSLTVYDGTSPAGIVSTLGLLEGIGRQVAPRDDCSTVSIVCHPQDYSASSLAHAVEDSGSHLVDLWSRAIPESGMLEVTMRLRCSDPSAACHNLERYGYSVTGSYSSGEISDLSIAARRLLELQTYLNV